MSAFFKKRVGFLIHNIYPDALKYALLCNILCTHSVLGAWRRQSLVFPFTASHVKMPNHGNSLVVQWLGLCAFTAEGVSSVPGGGTKIPQAA